MKKTIFTCLFGKYDALNPAPKYKGWDAVLFTDTVPENPMGWDVRVVNNELAPEKESRRYKFLSHIYLSEYDLVCYIDANMQLIENLPENDWICLRDIDTVPAYHEKFIEQCERIANDPQGFDLIGCMTNRLGLKYQLVPGMFDNWDIQEHRKVGKELSTNTNIKRLTGGQTVGGLMMLFSKQTWRKAGRLLNPSTVYRD